MNHYHLSYYGLLGERRGTSSETVQSPMETVLELYQSLSAEHAFGISSGDLHVAVNDEMVSWEHPLKDGDQVAFLPPMSGG